MAGIEPDEYAGTASSVRGVSDPWADEAPIVLGGAACAGASRQTSDSSNCGMLTTGILSSLDRAEVLIPLPGGRCARYVPLLLSDKKSAYTCTALRARRACVHVSTDAEMTVVTLSTLPNRKGITEKFKITRLQVDRWLRNNTWGGLAARVPHNGVVTGQLFLVRAATPVRIGSLGNPARLVERIRLRAESAGKTCRNARQHRADVNAWCERQRQYHAERIALESVRVDQNLRSLKSGPERADSLRVFLSYMNDKKASLSHDEWALFNVIVYNEISVFPDRDGGSSSAYATPYQLLDAIYGNSAISWGAKQIDFWGNLGKDIDDFWKEVSKPAVNMPTSFLTLRACLSNPGKTLSIAALKHVLTESPDWNAALDTPAMRKFHDDTFFKYVKKPVPNIPDLTSNSKLLRRSLLARVYYIDQVNQTGASVASGVIRAALAISISDSPNERELCSAETKLLEKYNKFLTDQGLDLYKERQAKLAKVINYLDHRTAPECKKLEK